MIITLLILALRLRATLPPEPLDVPRCQINWAASLAYRRQRIRLFRH